MKNVFITGGARGIGYSIALEFLKYDEYRVFIGDKSINDLNQDLLDHRIIPYQLDVSNLSSIESVFSNINELFGGIDILINNAGISPKHDGRALKLDELGLEEWNEVISTNLTGSFLCVKQVLPHMKQNKWGRIINISSQSARTAASIAGSHYAVSKTGLLGLSRQIASQFGEFNITSNSICPGRIASEMSRGVSEEANQRFIEHIPIKRMGKSEEVAALVRFLASEEGGYITGTTIDINGGAFIG